MNPDTSQVDLNTLQWVKSEIDETLKQARIALEQHVESPEGDSHLQLVVNYLHQVRGTLQMVELYGAAMLSEELEKLTQALLDKEVEGRDDIYEVMIRAMWQLPDYLERLQSGHKDIPMVLLPLLNDLRASRRAPLLTESALFTPDLDVDVPVSAESHGDENLPALAKKLRHTYHLGLLDWYREKDSAGGLKKLDNVIEKLRHAANDQEVNRVLWSASGVVEALREGGIEPSVAVKLLMGRLDREIKKIIDQGETVLQNERPADLEKNLLYYVASSSSDGEKVKSLKKTFKLAEALPDEATLERARADLTGPNAELLQTVSKVLLENMLQVKDQLDVFVRSDERDPAKLPAMCDSLVQTADTLGMLGFGKQRQIVMEQKDILESISNGTQSLDENILLDVAHALLSIENLLQGAKSGKTEININADDHAEKAEEAARQELLESVMAEARKNMGKVKEAMGAFLETPRNFTLISEVPDLLDQIRGSFNILGLDRPAQLVNTSCTYIQKEMIDARRSPDPASADALADALSSIEYYMDSMAGKWGNPNSILEVAEQRLAQMGLGEHIKPLHEGVAAVHAAEEVTESELSLNELTDEIELAGLVDSDEDTMIDLNATDGISAELHISTDDDTQNGLTVESADSSTAEISFDEMQEALESRGLSPDADTQNDTQEIDISGLMSVEDMTDEIDLSMTPVPTPVNEIDLSDLELPESDEIDISGLELIDIDAPEKKTHSELNEDESSQEISFHINAPDLADEEEESTSIDVLEIDDERFTIPADLDLEEPEATPNTTTQEIELDISQLDLPADDVADILNDAEIDNAPESDSEDTDISNRTQEIDISEYEIADGGQDLDNAPANIELSSEAADDNRSNDTQEIDFDSSIIEVIENPKLPEPLPVRQPQVGLSAKDIPELTSRLEAWYEDTRNEVLTKKLRRSITDIKKQAKQLGREDVAKVANDMAALFKSVNKGEMRLTEEVKNSLSFAIDTLSEVLPAEPPRAVVTPLQSSPIPTAPPKAYEVAEEIDEDIIEIFLEEAAEALEHIDQRLSDWRNNPDDEESLRELRRAFHTLKGSGRLVGASEAGEFAWAFENMLNRVIDRTIDSGPLIHDMVQQARDALPDLLELFRTGGRAGNEIFQLMEQADAISRGTVTASDLAVPTTTAGDVPDLSSLSGEYDMAMDEEPVPVPRSADLVPEIDETLLGIYRKETANHLDDLREYLHDWRSGKDRTANHNLVRALHTLKGSSRTAGVTGVAELCHRFEKLANEMSNHEIEVSDSMLDLLDRSINFVDETVSILDQPGAPLPDNSGLIEALSEQEQSISQGISSLVKLQLTPENDDNQDSSASLQSEYDTELLQIFIEEGDEILEESDQTLHNWAGDRTNDEYVEALQRQLHTLKGSARMAGVTVIGDLSHAIESMITAMVEGRIAAVDEVYDVLQYAQDKLVNMLEQLKSGQPLTPESDFINAVEQLTGTGVVFETSRADLKQADAESDTAVTPPAAEPELDEIEIIDLTDIEQPDADETPDDIAGGRLAEENTSRYDVVTKAEPAVEATLPDNVVPMTGRLQPLKVDKNLTTAGEEQLPEQLAPREQVRVRADLLDNLVNFAGEVSIYRSRMEQQTNAFRYNLTELDDTVSRLREQLRKFEMEAEAQIQYRSEESLSRSQEEFDPLEMDRFTQMQQLSRGMLESLNDLDSLRGILGNLTRESETLLVQQSRVNTELQEGLMRTRMVPFSTQAGRLRRIVRQTADELGKQAELHLHGADSELDRTVLDRMLPALEHMLRNAIAHGIEDEAERKRAGKSAAGQINLSLAREGADIIMTLSDDGAGINLDAIRRKAVEKGKIPANSNVTKEVLLEMIMESGFSTAETITQISGRGVGMDVVNSEIKQLGGLLNIDTEEGMGTTFTVSLPLTLSVTRALMVQVGEENYAIPLLSVEGVERVSVEVLQDIYNAEEPVYEWIGQDYPFMHLGAVMGVSTPNIPKERDKVPLLMVRSGEYRAAVQVEGLIGSREVVVKPVGPQLSTLRGISGATIMGDGSVVLIIDLGVLIRRAAQQTELAQELYPVSSVPEHVEAQPLIMVVDDSITVRKVTTRLLERNDYRAISAKDGVDALAQLQEVHPDIILLDVEMPRMDGFELATNIRNDEHLQDIPIIMITSRTGQKHRDRAETIGVNNYLGKPYNEAELLESIQNLLETA